MSDRRSMLRMLIGLSLCVCIWHISMQDTGQSLAATRSAYTVTFASDANAIDANTSQEPANVLAELPSDDQRRLINLTNFEYLIDVTGCGRPVRGSNATTLMDKATATATEPLVILVHSAPLNWAKRNVIRETWGRDSGDNDIGSNGGNVARTRVLFMLGAVGTAAGQRKIEQESYLYADIVQGNFADTYRNMTYKHVMSLKWFAYHCASADDDGTSGGGRSSGAYLVKTDDDVFVHTPNAYDFLRDPGTPRRQLLLCDRKTQSRVIRSYRNKWRVSVREYADRFYPAYCPGYSVVYSADVAVRLYREAQRTPYFWIDDVHVTGTLATAIDVPITPYGSLYLPAAQLARVLDGVADEEDVSAFAYFVFTVPNLSGDMIRSVWSAVVAAQRREAAKIGERVDGGGELSTTAASTPVEAAAAAAAVPSVALSESS